MYISTIYLYRDESHYVTNLASNFKLPSCLSLQIAWTLGAHHCSWQDTSVFIRISIHLKFIKSLLLNEKDC